jgi:DNA-binding SARP family transcriptional activator/Tfp pilus assembly protein PilF
MYHRSLWSWPVPQPIGWFRQTFVEEPDVTGVYKMIDMRAVGEGVLVQVLGAVRAWRDGHELDLGAPSRRTVLGILALAGSQSVHRSEIVDVLWGEHPPASATNVIQTHIKHLRRILEPDRPARSPSKILPAVGDGYTLSLPGDHVDLTQFRTLVATATRIRMEGDQRHAAALFAEALRLWHGAPLANIPALVHHPKVLALEVERRGVLARYGDLMIAIGAAVDALPLLEEAAAAQPLDEDAQARLIRAYHAVGQRGRAFAAYHATRHRLADELGVDPGLDLASTHSALLVDASTTDAAPTPPPAEPAPPPAPPALHPVPAQLPADIRDFTGRVEELRELDELFDIGAARDESEAPPTAMSICVISGTAGVGKTALTVHWAHRVRAQFPDGQLYVDLRGYDPEQPASAGDVLARFLTALGLPAEGIPLDIDGRSARYRTEMADRRALVVLDNGASLEQLRPLLPGSPSCAVLVTSRSSLAGLVTLHGAHRLNLDLLTAGDATTLLRRLIGARARSDERATALLAEQCARLPLALRLAAELASTQPTTRLTDLVRELEDQRRRLRRLDAGGDPRAAARAVFSWSYQHLPAPVALAFRRFGAHPGPSVEPYALAALTGGDLPHADHMLGLLSRAHLVGPAGAGRRSMHDLLRAYAAELSDTEDTPADRAQALARLFDYYLFTAVAAMDSLHPAERHHRPRVPEPETPTPPMTDPARARSWLEAELPTLKAVCAYAATHNWPTHAIRLATALFRYLESGHYADALTIHTDALHAARRIDDAVGRAHALTNLGSVYRLQGQYGPATEHLEQALAIHRQTTDGYGIARTLSHLGIVNERRGDYRGAVEHQQQALTAYRQLADRYGEAGSLINLGTANSHLGELEVAAENLHDGLTIFHSIGEHSGEAIGLSNLGDLYTQLGRYHEAAEHLERALALFRDLGHRYGEGTTLVNLGAAQIKIGRHQAATENLEEALVIFRDLGHRYGEASALNGLGEVRHATGRAAEALSHHTAALALAVETGDRDEQTRAQHGIARAHREIPQFNGAAPARG